MELFLQFNKQKYCKILWLHVSLCCNYWFRHQFLPSVCMLLIFFLQFHHRDPGIVGLLTSYDIPKLMFYGLIADGIHTHPTATRIAHRSHPCGNSLNTFLQSIILHIF